MGDNNKRALMAGMVGAASPLSEEAPPDGEVTWQDGTTTKVPLLSAQDAIVAIESTTEAPCSDCAMLLVRATKLTSRPIQTSRGQATARIGAFTVQRTAVKVTRVAIANPVVAVSGGGRSAAWACDRLGQRVGQRHRTHRRLCRCARSRGQAVR